MAASMSFFEDLESALNRFRDAVAIATEAKDMLPVGEKKKTLENVLVQAATNSESAKAQIAQVLGYHLCRCTFPPQIMLCVVDQKDSSDRFQCAACKRIESAAWPINAGPTLVYD